MATLASWDSGTLPTTVGSGVSSAPTGGPGGVPAIQFNQVASNVCQVRLTFTSRQNVAIRGYFLMPAAWASASQTIMAARPNASVINARGILAGTGNPGQVRLSKADPQASTATSSNSLVAVSIWYRWELLVDQATGKGRLGIFALQSDTPLYDSGWVSADFGTAVDRVEFGSAVNTTQLGMYRCAALKVTDDITNWVGRAAWDAQLDTPVVTVTGTTPSNGNDGTATVTWPAVPGAANYTAYLADGSSPAQGDFVEEEDAVISPYTFFGLTPGTKSFGIQARV